MSETIQLDEISMLEIDLVMARLRAAELEEKLAVIAVRDAREKKAAVLKDENELTARIAERLGMPGIQSVKLVDRKNRMCVVERTQVAGT